MPNARCEGALERVSERAGELEDSRKRRKRAKRVSYHSVKMDSERMMLDRRHAIISFFFTQDRPAY
jgi:hypothetical protein